MSFINNLAAFNTQIESAIADIPQEKVTTDPNIYRLIKLLSWAKIASGSSSGGGGGGGLSRTDLALELQDLKDALALQSTEAKQTDIISALQNLGRNSSLDRLYSIDITYLSSETSRVLIPAGSFTYLRHLSFTLSSLCKLEIFQGSIKLATFRGAQSIDIPFNNSFVVTRNLTIEITETTNNVILSGYAVVSAENV